MSDPIAINDRPYLSGRAVFPEGRWRPILTLGGEWRPTLTLMLWLGVLWPGTKDSLAVARLCTGLALIPSCRTAVLTSQARLLYRAAKVGLSESRMGVYRHLLGNSDSIVHFRDLYKVPSNVEVRPDTPDDGLTYRDGWMPFWLVSVVEGGVRFPLHPLVRDCLWEWRLCPCQLLPNVYKIIMGVVRLNQILGIGLGVPDIEDTYDLCKSAEGDTYYLRLRVRRTGFVTALEDSNRYAGEDKVLVRGGWEFGEVEPATTVRVPRKIGIPPNFREKRELARRNRWKVNSAWHELVRNYRGHNCRAAWCLLGYVPHYRSFNTSRKVSGIDSVLSGEGASQGTEAAVVPSSATVTVAIPAGRLVELAERAPAVSAAESARPSRAKPPSSRTRLAAFSSEEEEEEEEMLRQRGRRYAAEDLSAAAFGDIGGEVRDPPQAVAAAPPASPGGIPAPDVEAVSPAVVAAARPDEAGVVTAPPPPVTTVVPPSDHAAGAGRRARSAEAAEGGRPEKRARVEASPGPSTSSAGGTILPPPPAPWRPAIEGSLGRPLAETDRATNPQVVAALGRACALPQDMARWAEMDNESLLLSSMQSVVQLLQKCQVGIERLDAAEARAAEWVVERDELRASLASKDATLAEVTAKNAGLVVDFEESKVEVQRLKDELEDEKVQNQHLSSELDDLRAAAKQLEDELKSTKGTNKRLLSQRNQAQSSLEKALRGKAAEIESALAKQEDRLKGEFLAEHDSIMEEEVGKLTADYKAQLPGIRDRAWELGWKAALEKAGVPEDSPLFLNALRFSCSDPGLAAVSQVSSDPPSQSCPEAIAAPEVPQEASVVSADPGGCQVAAAVEVPPEAAVVCHETAPTATEASTVAAEIPPEIDCNAEAAAP
ncbi:hypothetical protein MRB53_003236 [Persea americana]|uniref:Uncharacterized protein n=1 Tax=Persea americana TaxID=3435 RepID=A0ACC2MX18_PERAE|nr:hypothetical protein MRB53_003236 [Persea americana]